MGIFQLVFYNWYLGPAFAGPFFILWGVGESGGKQNFIFMFTRGQKNAACQRGGGARCGNRGTCGKETEKAAAIIKLS